MRSVGFLWRKGTFPVIVGQDLIFTQEDNEEVNIMCPDERL